MVFSVYNLETEDVDTQDCEYKANPATQWDSISENKE